MKIKSHYKIFITSIISIAVIVALFIIFIDISRQADNLRTSLNQIESKVLFSEKEIKAVHSSQEAIKNSEGDIARLQQSFIKRSDPVSFIDEIENLAKKTGNTFVIDLDEDKSKDAANLYFRIAVDGRADTVLKYLHLVELLPYKISVEELVWQKLDSVKASHRLNILISVATF